VSESLRDGRCFVVAQPDYDGDNIDSIWLNERDAKKRAADLGSAFLTEYRLNATQAWVRSGWYMKGKRRRLCWSDWR
jgi:hypothetical protein